ncbi:hypothetical protein JCM10914A_31670 [Paenibacillus sp. JCM 10914]|nr:rRNA adenine N-6-methyltransferase [Paenibacillus sp. JCM 10914]
MVSKPNDRSGQTPNFPAQNMLINRRLIQDMIDLAQIDPAATVLDIGAGTGAITLPLAEKAAHVLAIENDPALANKLLSKLQGHRNVRVKASDFLIMPLPKPPFSVVSNIPYSITTPIIGKLLDHPTVPLQRAVLLVQKGAARGFTSSNSLLNPRILCWRMWFDIRLIRTVPPHYFAPPPKVESAVLVISRKNRPLVPPQQYTKFFAMAAHALRYPQQPLFAAFGDIFSSPQMTKVVRTLGVQRDMPIRQLKVEQWGQLFLAMIQHVPAHRWPKQPKRGKQHSRKR